MIPSQERRQRRISIKVYKGYKGYDNLRFLHLLANLQDVSCLLETQTNCLISTLYLFQVISPCQSKLSNKYQLINGICIYFENETRLNFEEAQENCKTKFGETMKGQLFEPLNINMNSKVADAAVEIDPSLGWYIGKAT